MTPALTLLGWADITQLLNQVVHARSQPDTLPLYVPTESVARVREVQAALNESLVQMPSLEPVRLADQFPEVGEMVGRTYTRDDVIAAAQAVGMPDLWLACFADSLLDYIGKMLDAAALRPAAQPVGEPVATVVSWTNGSYSRNYKLEWHRDVPEGTNLYPTPQPVAVPERVPMTDELEQALEMLVEQCNQDAVFSGAQAVIHAEAVLERLYKSRTGITTPSNQPARTE